MLKVIFFTINYSKSLACGTTNEIFVNTYKYTIIDTSCHNAHTKYLQFSYTYTYT